MASEKKSPPVDVDAATFTIEGEVFSVIAVPGVAGVRFAELSDAENEVCRMMLAGLSNAEISKARRTSINTVENQATSIFRKLQVSSRYELAVLVREQGRDEP